LPCITELATLQSVEVTITISLNIRQRTADATCIYRIRIKLLGQISDSPLFESLVNIFTTILPRLRPFPALFLHAFWKYFAQGKLFVPYRLQVVCIAGKNPGIFLSQSPSLSTSAAHVHYPLLRIASCH
ncbi:MAG: hypothetical protein ABGZ17_07660, partial [Planctomycetaceae bacterium]